MRIHTMAWWSLKWLVLLPVIVTRHKCVRAHDFSARNSASLGLDQTYLPPIQKVS